MRKLVALVFLVVALSAMVTAKADGPGGGTLWEGMPWSNIVHCHGWESSRSEVYVKVAGNDIGVGFNPFNPASTAQNYVIGPAPLHSSDSPENSGKPCADSLIP